MDNLEKLATLGTQDTGWKQTKQKTQHRKKEKNKKKMSSMVVSFTHTIGGVNIYNAPQNTPYCQLLEWYANFDAILRFVFKYSYLHCRYNMYDGYIKNLKKHKYLHYLFLLLILINVSHDKVRKIKSQC